MILPKVILESEDILILCLVGLKDVFFLGFHLARMNGIAVEKFLCRRGAKYFVCSGQFL